MKNFNSNIDYYSLTITTIYTLIINFVINSQTNFYFIFTDFKCFIAKKNRILDNFSKL